MGSISLKKISCSLLVSILLISNIFAATKVSGSISNEAGEPMIGVNVFIEDKYIGTSSDIEGNILLETDLTPPFTLVISAIGYTEQRLEISEAETILNPILIEKPYMANDVVVSASRIKESYLSLLEKTDEVPYQKNTLAIFLCSKYSIHGVSPRLVTSHSRRLVNIIAEFSSGRSCF